MRSMLNTAARNKLLFKMAQIGSGEVKKKLYDMFKGRIETDIVDMVYAGCNYKGIILYIEYFSKLSGKSFVIVSLPY